jgi:hypothetical protein
MGLALNAMTADVKNLKSLGIFLYGYWSLANDRFEVIRDLSWNPDQPDDLGRFRLLSAV